MSGQMGDVRRFKAQQHEWCTECSDPIEQGDDAGSINRVICCGSCVDFEDGGGDWWDDL